MNVHELDEFKLEDTVKFHNRLNPRLWGRDEHLLPAVRDKLLEIAADFQEFLGVADLDVKDITISGSNAAYSYSPNSDVDLHLVVSMPDNNNEVYQELFNAKKYQYNDQHNIKIGGADVELYVQPDNEPAVSQGVYSIANNKWISVPRRKKAQIDDTCVRHKVEDIGARIADAIASGDEQRMIVLKDKIKRFRQSGLDQQGEFGCDNLAFKVLRNQGDIKKLYDAINAAKDHRLSLAERNRPRQRVRYGFGEGHQGQPYSSEDGVAPSTCMFLNEEEDQEKIVHQFIEWVADRLGIDQMPEIFIHTDPKWSVEEHSFGRYEPDSHSLHVNMANRHLLDILRTTAHELVHCRQNQEHTLPADAGKTGSRWENEAHAKAGVIMRDFADAHPELFDSPALQESASGYIPTKKQAKDPRYAMALTVDIKPGEVGRQANKMGLETDSQGHPKMVYKSANQLSESRAVKSRYGYAPLTQEPGSIEDDLGNQEATGPEFPPQFPEGTTKIDVSDVYDWYKIGQKISDMDDIDPEDVGQGPPQTVITFPSDEAEQAYLKQFKRLGLKTHDIDAGREHYHEDLMRELAEEFALLEDEFLGEIKMSPTNLRAEAAKTGAQAGMEFEMIVPNAGDVDNEPEYEPDYDQDQRSRSFEDIRDFFHDGDYNSRRDVNDLIAEMQEQFVEWQDEQILNSWDNEGFELLKEYIKDNGYFDDDEAQEEATNALQAEYGDDITPEDFEKMLEALISEKFDEFVQDQWDNQGQFYDEAREQYMDEQRGEYDEREWLDEHYGYMSDIERNFDISWPHWHDPNEGEEADIDAIADDFSNSVGKPVNASRSYHGARREPGHYVVEPDGSLEGNEPGDAGLEFVSPPMPIDEMMSDLNKVKAWADREGCYTNSSTGLHINISVPNYSLEKLDYVKLALLLGDKYILDQYGRASNTYTKSALGKVQDKVKQQPDTARAMLDKMRNGMEQLASKAIHSGSTDKYTSINTKSGYIEFRSPGGDWLNENFDKIENTLLRFTVALSAAMDPEAYRQEYLKKLYKLLEPTAVETKNPDTVKYFADYVAGKTPRAALRSFVKQAQLQRKIAKDPTGGQPYWWRVSNPQYSHGEIEVVAKTKEEAIEKSLLPDGYPSWARTRASIQAVPVRPYDASPLKATVGEPQAIGQNSDPTVGGRPSNPAGRWVITPETDRQSVVYRFNAAGFDDANVVRRQWAQEHPGVWIVQRDDNQTLGQPAGSSRNALSQTDIENRLGWPDQTGDANYEVVDRRTQQSVFKFVANTDQDALRKYSQYLDVMGMPEDTEDYGFREIVVPGSTVDLQRQRAAQAQQNQQTWNIVNRNTGEVAGTFTGTEHQAEDHALNTFGHRFIYDVVPAQQQQPAPRPLGAGRELVGWEIRIDGQPVHTLSGIGNNQGDANRLAQQWVLQQGSNFLRQHQGGEVEVVPAWREA